MEEDKSSEFKTGGIVNTYAYEEGMTRLKQEEVILSREQAEEFYKLIDKIIELKIDSNNSTM